MRIVLAPDSLKESIDAPTAASAMARGVRDAHPDATCIEVPLADGGEGTGRTLTAALGGTFHPVTCTDARGRSRSAEIGLVRDAPTNGGTTAVVETAEANGLGLIEPPDRDVLDSSTSGVADLILAALDAGAKHLIVGVGGSATTDGGAGLLAGLGARLLDAAGHTVAPVPRELHRLSRIDLSGLDTRLEGTRITVASDVTSPLTGPEGAAAVFGPQKGATPGQVPVLDNALSTLADAVETATGKSLRDTPGAGAAGGLGFALLTLGADLRPGIDVVTDATGLRSHLEHADLVLTAEGAVDAQSATGKVPSGVARLAAAAGVPVVVLAGRVDAGADVLFDHPDFHVAALVPIMQGPSTLEQALQDGPTNLRRATATTLRLISLQLSS